MKTLLRRVRCGMTDASDADLLLALFVFGGATVFLVGFLIGVLTR